MNISDRNGPAGSRKVQGERSMLCVEHTGALNTILRRTKHHIIFAVSVHLLGPSS